MPGDRYRCCGIQAKSSLLPPLGAERGPESEPHSLQPAQQLSRDPLSLVEPLSTHKLPQLCQNPARLPLAEVTEVPPWTWGLSLGLSKTLMVSGGSYSNNLPSPLSVHLQLCLRIYNPTRPPQLSQQ